jgi:hypothetical protein
MIWNCFGWMRRGKLFVFTVYDGEKKILDHYTVEATYYDDLKVLMEKYPDHKITSMYLGEGEYDRSIRRGSW